MNWELFYTKGAAVALVVFFFLLIVFFLRFLYGPKGIFRDPQWDAWNREERDREEKAKVAKVKQGYKDAFLNYARSFHSGDAEENAARELKVDHSLRVLAHAEKLAATEPAFADPIAAKALWLAALFHDVGRFEQFRRYHTFADALSCNHGALGARITRSQGFLRGESPEVQRLVLSAIAAHNKLKEPAGLRGRTLDVLLALKDADKLDILRVMAANLAPGAKGDGAVLLHLKDEPLLWSAAVEQSLEEGRVALYSDMRYVNDFRLLLCTWLHDFRYRASLAIVRREGHFTAILAGLAPLPDLQRKAAAVVRQYLGENIIELLACPESAESGFKPVKLDNTLFRTEELP
jgi:putative nucleotidyltransferase with HDIG domain